MLAPKTIIAILAQTPVFGAAVPAFPFPVGQHCDCCHHHWRHWLHCHCSSCLLTLPRLQESVSCPVPIFWITLCASGEMQHEVISTHQCHILVTTHETCCNQWHCECAQQCCCPCCHWDLLKGSHIVISDRIDIMLGLKSCQTANPGWSPMRGKRGVMQQKLI